MASAHQRKNGRRIGMYRADGRQMSAGTCSTEAAALHAALGAELYANPPETVALRADGLRDSTIGRILKVARHAPA